MSVLYSSYEKENIPRVTSDWDFIFGLRQIALAISLYWWCLRCYSQRSFRNKSLLFATGVIPNLSYKEYENCILMNFFGVMLITWLLYRTIKICGCHFQRCFSKLMHLNIFDTILSLIIFCYRGFSENQKCSALLEQNFIAKYGLMNMLKASGTFCSLIGNFIHNTDE